MATFTVINTDDSGPGSLRQAIEDANTTTGLDTIEFDEDLSGQKITLTSGQLQIRDDLTISGLGADELTVSGNNSSLVFLVDDFNSSNQIEVVIDGLTIADGNSDGAGGILNRENLILNSSTVSNNFSGFSGGGINSAGILTVNNSKIEKNDAAVRGGGIGVAPTGTEVNGKLTLNNSIVSANSAGDRGGGGIAIGSNVEATIDNSTISDNFISTPIGNIQFAGGGGIRVEFLGTLNLIDSTVSNNDSVSSGGGIDNSEFTRVINSTIAGNKSRGFGGGINNTTRFGAGILEVNNSTISGNTSGQGGGGINNDTGTLGGATATVTNSTITNNTTDQFETGSSGGGGLFNDAGSSFQVENTIIAENFDTPNNAGPGTINPDVSGTFTSKGYNLVGDNTGSSGFGVSGDQVGISENPIDPLIGPLQDNGGSTQTHALFTGSPAIDAGNPDFEPPPEFDQRGPGFPRVLDGDRNGTATVDIGAFELANIINGTPGDDLLIGTPGSDRIKGFAGNDTIIGKAGDDTIDGGHGDDLIVGQEGNDNLTGGGNRDKFAMAVGEGTDTITDFGGVGRGSNPPQWVIHEVDTIQFFGSGLIVKNMLLTQNGLDLEIAFEGVGNTKVILQNFKLENLDNLPQGIGNILFDGQQELQDGFDVVNANDNRSRVFNRNTVTFLNDLDNNTRGFSQSDDVINGQGGNDTLKGLSGDDLLRGGAGFDILTGNSGADQFSFSTSKPFSFSDVGIDKITDFKPTEADKIVLSKTTFTALTSAAGGALDSSEFEAVANDDAASTSNAFITYSNSTGNLFYNENGSDAGFGKGAQFANLQDIPTLSAKDFLITG